MLSQESTGTIRALVLIIVALVEMHYSVLKENLPASVAGQASLKLSGRQRFSMKKILPTI